MPTSTPTGSNPANIIDYRCSHGGHLEADGDDMEYVGGIIEEGTLDICELNMKQIDGLVQRLGYHIGDVECFSRFQNGKEIQMIYDNQTIEQLRIEGATYGKIELYLVHSPTNYNECLGELNVNASNVVREKVDVLNSTEDTSVDNLEETYCSEIEEAINDEDGGSTDDEFKNVQMNKKDWVSKRNSSGKNSITKDFQVNDTTITKGAKRHKDNYWGNDDDDNSFIVPEHGGQYIERDSDDEGPLSLSDDDEDLETLQNCEWLLYDPKTSFGFVHLEVGQLFVKVEVLKKLSARYTKEYKCLQIRFFKDIHTCAPTKLNKKVTSDFLAEEYHEKLLKHPTWKLKLFIKDVEDTYGVKINRWLASRAKKNALSACGKVVRRQYDSLKAYTYELKRSNVGTSVFLSLKSCIPGSMPQFRMIYINFSAIRHNFLHGCKRVIGLDGAFLKGFFKGEILCAVARDGNNQMFPVAWAVVESESKESWSWFLGHLINDLNMQNGEGWTLLSDQQKGLLIVIAQMLPNAEHRLCARHIFTNWIKVVKGAPLHKLYWKAVKAYTDKEFNDVMGELKQQSQRAHNEMCARDVTKFCRCFYKTWACTDVTCNNMAETFNSWILEAREKPILTMLEEIRRQVMSRMVKKKEEATKCNGITPRIRAKLNDFTQATKNWIPIEASTNVYEVQHTLNSALSYTVRLDKRACACKYWDVNGIPCEHATSVIHAINQNPENYVAIWYKKETYEASYSLSLEPLNGQGLWESVEEGSILPSDPRVKCGRPSNKRKMAHGEARRKPIKYRIPKSGKQLCSGCQKVGHNRRTCPKNQDQGSQDNGVSQTTIDQ